MTAVNPPAGTTRESAGARSAQPGSLNGVITWICEVRDHGRPGQGAAGTQDQPGRLLQVAAQVVVQHGGQLAAPQQGHVVAVQVVGDEAGRGAADGAEGLQDGGVAAADGVDGVDARGPRPGRSADGGQGAAVQPVGLGHLDQPAIRGELGHGPPEAGLPLPLAVEGAAGQRHQHAARVGAGRPGDQVRRGRPGGPVVDAHVRDPSAGGHIGDQGDGGDAGRGQLVDRRGDQRVVGGLEQDPVAAPAPDPLQRRHHVGGVTLLREVEPGPQHRRPQLRQLGLQRRPDGVAEPPRAPASPGRPGTSARPAVPGRPAGPGRRSPAAPRPACSPVRRPGRAAPGPPSPRSARPAARSPAPGTGAAGSASCPPLPPSPDFCAAILSCSCCCSRTLARPPVLMGF